MVDKPLLSQPLPPGWGILGLPGDQLTPPPKTHKNFYCLRQVHLAENLPRATHTQKRVETT